MLTLHATLFPNALLQNAVSAAKCGTAFNATNCINFISSFVYLFLSVRHISRRLSIHHLRFESPSYIIFGCSAYVSMLRNCGTIFCNPLFVRAFNILLIRYLQLPASRDTYVAKLGNYTYLRVHLSSYLFQLFFVYVAYLSYELCFTRSFRLSKLRSLGSMDEFLKV